uniref:Substance-K receptor n=1 Tax=Geotrypetes seraphini TaxID=260995 RepID=A0A6P8RC05_GEOSA|nr:substance-K receptor [Geotrypetes seraphini]
MHHLRCPWLDLNSSFIAFRKIGVMSALFFSKSNASHDEYLGVGDDNGTSGNSFAQPAWQVALWAITYSAIVIVSVVGNVTVIWIILAHKRMRTVTNSFIVNLAFSDVFMAIFNTIFNFIYASHNVWYFDKGFCRFHNLFPVTAMFVSIYTMTAVAADRYIAIIHPFKLRLSAVNTKIIIGIIWLVAFGLAFPQYFYADIIDSNGRKICLVDWPEENGAQHQLVYHIMVIVLIYLLPLLLMLVAYIIIGVTLWGNRVPVEESNVSNYQHQTKVKKRIVKTMIMVVVAFAISWLPFHLYFILGQFKADIYKQKYIQQVYLAIFLLAMSSAMFNPIIYCCLNETFRSGFKVAFQWCPCVNATEEDKLKLSYPTMTLPKVHSNSKNNLASSEGKHINCTEKLSLTLTSSLP